MFGCEPDINHFNYARDKLNLKGIKNDILAVTLNQIKNMI